MTHNRSVRGVAISIAPAKPSAQRSCSAADVAPLLKAQSHESAEASAGQPEPLSTEHLQAIQAARWSARKVTRAARIATFSGWTLAVMACITMLFGIFSLRGFLLGAAMAAVAWRELQGARGIRDFDPGSPRMLAVNQCALAAILVMYAVWGIGNAVLAPSPYEAQIAQGGRMARMVEPVAQLHVVLSIAIYSLMIVGGVLATGLTALYYVTRRARIESFLRGTPDWVVRTLRASQ